VSDDFEIGRVTAVSTASVTIELNPDLKALTRSTYEGAHDVGRINSYVILPVGARRLVAMVTQIMLSREAEITTDRTMVTLPSARRVLRATLIGTIDGDSYTQGISVFPVLDTPALLVTERDLSTIFDVSGTGDETESRYCVQLGESTIFSGLPIHIDPDAFFGKHAAILGSTGSGKSSTIAGLIQAITRDPAIKRSNFVILDTNGEYRTALPESEGALYIPTDPQAATARLVIPYWFLDSEDFVRLFQASKGVQRPVLLEALRIARNETSASGKLRTLREDLTHELNRLWSLSGSDAKESVNVRDIAKGLGQRLKDGELEDAWATLAEKNAALSRDTVLERVRKIYAIAKDHVSDGRFPKVIPADARVDIQQEIEAIQGQLNDVVLDEDVSVDSVSADSPAFFDKRRFRAIHLEHVLRREESGGARARDYSGTLLLRIDRLLQDTRFEFLLGPVGARFPNVPHDLAAFVRDLLGMASAKSPSPPLAPNTELDDGTFPFYARQRLGSEGHTVVVVDLSLLAAEVLENVTALIGRLILEFLQRLGEHAFNARASLPVVLVLEEAQNYVREGGADESVSRQVFERVAREGRKFGLGLVIASQRPSEISKTVLS
jgi:uncharacterized protein